MLHNLTDGYRRTETVIDDNYQGTFIHKALGQKAEITFVHQAPVAAVDKHVHRRISAPGQEKVEGPTLAESIRHI